MDVKKDDKDSKAEEKGVESKSMKLPESKDDEAFPELEDLEAQEEEDSKAGEESSEEESSEKKEEGSEEEKEDDTLTEDLKAVIAKEEEASKKRPQKNIDAEIDRKVKEALAKQEKSDVALPPTHTKEEVDAMLQERYPEMMDTNPKLARELFQYNQHYYEEVFKPNWEKEQLGKANAIKSEQQAKESIKTKPYYATLKPVIDSLIAEDPVAQKLTGAEKYAYLYEKAYNKYVPLLIQRRVKGVKNQAKEKHKLILKDDISEKSELSSGETSEFHTLDASQKAYAKMLGITEKDYDNPLLKEGGTVIDIDS